MNANFFFFKDTHNLQRHILPRKSLQLALIVAMVNVFLQEIVDIREHSILLSDSRFFADARLKEQQDKTDHDE